MVEVLLAIASWTIQISKFNQGSIAHKICQQVIGKLYQISEIWRMTLLTHSQQVDKLLQHSTQVVFALSDYYCLVQGCKKIGF